MADEKRPAGRKRRPAYDVPPSQQVLVAVLNNRRDFARARDENWYRIPVGTAPRRGLNARHIAFYQTRAFGKEGMAIRWRAEIVEKRQMSRRELLPEEIYHPRADAKYWCLTLGPLQPVDPPIISRRGRRLAFLTTTLRKFALAREVNDLFHESPLEDELWEAFRQERIEAERQFYLSVRTGAAYCLDFALFCANGKVAVECDGDTWHADRERIPLDNARSNALEAAGWHVLRFNTRDIESEMPQCVRVVRETVNRYGGLETAEGETRWFAESQNKDGSLQQLNLFQEKRAAYDTQG